jgi:tetratricopeptide (TPR) repeat protein
LINFIPFQQPHYAIAQEQSPEQELFFIAQKAFDDGFYDVSIRYIEQFFQKFPASSRYTQARLLLGQCYFFKNQYLKALELFQSIQQNPAISDAVFFWLGETYFKGADYKQAQSYYLRVIENFPESEYIPQSYYSLGWTMFAQGNYQDAINYFETLTKTYPAHNLSEDALFKIGEAHLNLAQYKNAIAIFEKYTLDNPKSTRLANAFFYLGESCYYDNDLLKANTYYAKAAELSSDPQISFMSHLGMGWIYLKLKKYGLSENSFHEAEKTSAKYTIPSGEILLGKGALYIETDRFPEALAHYENFLKLYPQNARIPDAMTGKANALYLLERYDDAIKTYESLIDYAKKHTLPQDMIEKSYYGIAWSFLKQGMTDKAIQTFQMILEKSSSKTVKASALTQIGDAYQDTKQFSQALIAYDRVLKEFSDGMYTDYAQFQQGITLLKMGNEESAKFSFQSLKKNFPTSTYLQEAEYYLGFAYFQNQEWPPAIQHITAFLESSASPTPFTAQAHYILALSYFHDNNFKKALELFKGITKQLMDQPSIQQTAEVYIGKCLYNLKQVNDAIKHFRQICQNYPLSDAHQDALLWLGSFYLSQSDFTNAITYYTAFIENFPGSEKINTAYYELGQSYYGSGSLEQSLKAFHQVKNTNPDIFAKAQLAIADIFSQEADSNQAIASYRQIADQIPDYRRDALVKIAKIYTQRDNPQRAIEIYQEAIAAKQERSQLSDAELIFSMADQYEILNQRQKAVDEYLKIPYLHQKETAWVLKAYLRIARIFENKEDWNEAMLAYEKIITLNVDESSYAKERIKEIQTHISNQP